MLDTTGEKLSVVSAHAIKTLVGGPCQNNFGATVQSIALSTISLSMGDIALFVASVWMSVYVLLFDSPCHMNEWFYHSASIFNDLLAKKQLLAPSFTLSLQLIFTQMAIWLYHGLIPLIHTIQLMYVSVSTAMTIMLHWTIVSVGSLVSKYQPHHHLSLQNSFCPITLNWNQGSSCQLTTVNKSITTCTSQLQLR